MTLLKQIKILMLGIVFFVMLSQLLIADFKGEIKEPEGTVQGIDIKIVDYGLCFIGDSLIRTFTLKNTGTEILKLGTTDPTYYKGLYPKIANHDNDHFEFNPPLGDEPAYPIPPGGEKKLIMIYFADDTVQYKAGKKYAMLKLGLYDSKIPDQPSPGYANMIVLDSFLLIARKTTHYIDGYESENYFDSVYVNPPSKVLWIWQVKNVSKDDLKIESDSLIPRSPNPDFMINKISQLPIYQKNVIDCEIEYHPKDMGGDSAIYQLKYHPHPILYPDSVDYAKVKLYGIGVKQNLDIDFADVKFYGDTLDFGEVWVDSTKETMAVLKNNGNMKFGTISQSILNNKDVPDSVFTLLGGIKELPFNLDTNKTDTFRIKFSPKERGTFISKYFLNSDIASRKIKGIPADGLNEKIYIKGTGIEPEPTVASDTLDMGNVVLHLDCPSAETLNVPINNIGNTALDIQYVSIDSPFTPIIPIPEFTIPVNSQGIIKVVFDAKVFGLGDYSDTLFIVSRDVKPPKDTIKIIVKASSVLPQETRLLIPDDIKAKPGRLISVPIIVDKRNINTARTFSDTLTCDTTLLKYNGFENSGTASESAALIFINPESTSSRLSIYIEKTGLGYFEQSDTLILLKFNTYLGDKVSTPIAFADPRFGNGPCSKVLTPKIINGIFTLDSICGLNLKAIPRTTKQFRFEDIYPNPANDKIQFEYEMAFSTNIKISVYNSYGELVENVIDRSLPAGTYLLTYPTNNMTPGIYYFEMQAGLFRQIKKVVLTK